MRQYMPLSRPVLQWNALAIPKNVGDRVPLRWEQFLGRRKYGFILEWNELGGFYVLAIWYGDHEVVRTALQYGWDALDRFQYLEEVRGLMIVPFDPSLAEMENGITKKNLGKTVLLFYLAREGT